MRHEKNATGWEPTPWHGDAAGGVRSVEESGVLGGCRLRHGLAKSPLALEQRSLALGDQAIGLTRRR